MAGAVASTDLDRPALVPLDSSRSPGGIFGAASEGIGHEVVATDEAEDADAVVLVEDAQGAQNLTEGASAGGDVVDDEHVLLADGGAQLLVSLGRKAKELGHVGAETAFLDIARDGEVVLVVDEVEHLLDAVAYLLLLCLGVAWPPILKHIVEILFFVCLHVERDVGGQVFQQLDLLQHRLREAVDVAEHVLVDLARRLGHDHEVEVVEVDATVEAVHGLLDELSQVGLVLQAVRELDVMDEGGAEGTAYLVAELIAVVEAMAEGLHLIAVAGEADEVVNTIVLKVEHESLCLVVEAYTHILMTLMLFPPQKYIKSWR